jgi:hypothetical protein
MREGCGGEKRVSEEDEETEDGGSLPFVLLEAHHHQPPHGAHLTQFKLTQVAFYIPVPSPRSSISLSPIISLNCGVHCPVIHFIKWSATEAVGFILPFILLANNGIEFDPLPVIVQLQKLFGISSSLSLVIFSFIDSNLKMSSSPAFSLVSNLCCRGPPPLVSDYVE